MADGSSEKEEILLINDIKTVELTKHKRKENQRNYSSRQNCLRCSEIAVQKCYVVNKDKVGNILALETARDLNITKLQNANKNLDECESCKNIKLQNVREIVLARCPSCKNRTIKQDDKNTISKGETKVKKKHENKVYMKLPNMENVNSEFRIK